MRCAVVIDSNIGPLLTKKRKYYILRIVVFRALMMKNKEYKKLTDYLYEILHKLQNQSSWLRYKDIAICLSEEKNRTNNTYYNFISDTIIVGLNHLRKYAGHSEDAVAALLAHELSHKVFREKYSVSGSKEEEIFADNYGLILCKKAGYNTNISLWNDPLSLNVNSNVHPQHKIRQLVMKRTSARLSEGKTDFTPFKESIPIRNTLREYAPEMIARRVKSENVAQQVVALNTDIDFLKKNDDSNEGLMYYLLSFKRLKAEHQPYITIMDLSDCEYGDVIKLYGKIRKSRSLSKDTIVLQMFRNGLIKHRLMMHSSPEGSDILNYLDSFFINKTENAVPAQKRLIAAKHLMNMNHRCNQKQNRQKVYDIFADSLKELYGTDNGSDDYIEIIKNQLDDLSGKIHNADVLPLSQTLKNTLDINENHAYILQNFVRNNSFEMQQIRAETLITECLINGEQAVKTVNYLINDNVPPFHFKGIYDPSAPDVRYSSVNAEMLKDIHDDWATVNPDKRADIFILLMENIPAKNAFEKLSLFIDKKDKNSLMFKSVIKKYLDTYPEEQQHRVAATLVSLKKIDEPLGYEECFKAILQNSGIAGSRIYDRIYQAKSPDLLESEHRSYEPVYSNGEIVYANLYKLQKALSQSPDAKSQKMGEQMRLAMPVKFMGRTYFRE